MLTSSKLKQNIYGSLILDAATICVDKGIFFYHFDSSFIESVKMGNDSSLDVQGKGWI
jgi:hypothetical protein